MAGGDRHRGQYGGHGRAQERKRLTGGLDDVVHAHAGPLCDNVGESYPHDSSLADC